MNINLGTGTRISSGISTRLKTGVGIVIGQITSTDGAQIGYRQIGRGPGLMLLHGGARSSQQYMRLAEALADEYTVTIPDRRDCGLSGPRGAEYGLQTELDDLSVLMRRTGARKLFGHGAGGYFALEAALQLPVEKMVLFEPAVLIGGACPLDWLTAFEQALDQRDSITAMLIFLKGLGVNWTEKPAERRDGLSILPYDSYGLTCERYPQIGAETLLLGGKLSPAFLREILVVLSRILPRARVVELTGLDHTAPDQTAPNTIAMEVKRFMG